MTHLSHWDQHLPDKGRVLSRWLNCIGLLIDNMIVPVIVFQIFNSIAELGAANLSEVSNWQAVTQNLGVRLLSDIFGISDFFWKLGAGIIIEHETILGSLRYMLHLSYSNLSATNASNSSNDKLSTLIICAWTFFMSILNFLFPEFVT